MSIPRILIVAAMALTTTPALAAGPGLGTPGARSPGLGAPGQPSPGFGSSYTAPRSNPTTAPRPSYSPIAPVAPIARIPQPKPADRFKPFEGRSTYDNPGGVTGYPSAPKPKGYLSPY